MITSTVMSGIRLLMLTEEEVVTCQKSARKDGQLRDEKDDFVAQAAVAQNNSTTGCGSLRQAVDGYGEGLGTLWFGSGSPSVVQRWSGGRAMEKDWGRGVMYHKKMDECEGRDLGGRMDALFTLWLYTGHSMAVLGTATVLDAKSRRLPTEGRQGRLLVAKRGRWALVEEAKGRAKFRSVWTGGRTSKLGLKMGGNRWPIKYDEALRRYQPSRRVGRIG